MAIANLDTALRCKPDYPEAWFQKGFALGSLGRHEDAIACFDEMLKLRSNDSWVWHNRAIALGKLERHLTLASLVAIYSHYDYFVKNGNTLRPSVLSSATWCVLIKLQTYATLYLVTLK